MKSLPIWAERLLKAICSTELFEQIEGDLIEIYNHNVKTIGEKKAKLRFVFTVIRFFRPGILLRNKNSFRLNTIDMLQNYTKISFRQLMKHKVFSLINLCGLALGMAASFLIIHYVSYEMSFDTFHKNADRIYRVCHNRYQDGTLQYEKAQTFIPTGEAMKNDFPEVQDFTTLFKISDQAEINISYHDENGETVKFNEENVYHVKGNFLNIFSISIVSGANRITLEPKTVLISSSVSKKYFGDTSPLNRIIHHTYNGDYTVVGVFEDIPDNSHLKPDFLFAWQSVSEEAQGGDATNWHWDGFYTYILLTPSAKAESIEPKLEQFTKKYLSNAQDRIGESKFWLQPLTDIHLSSHLSGEAGVNGNNTTVNILKGLAIFILLMAYINFINLSSAKAIDRAKEVGVRKIVGSGRSELIRQFLLESLIVNLISIILAGAIVSLLIFQFGNTLGLPATFDVLKEKEFWIALTGLLIVGSFCSGIYPAFIISSFTPMRALKGKITAIRKDFSLNLRRGMVTFQFVLAMILITGSAMIYKQVKYMNDQDLGIDINQTMVLRTFAKFGPPGSDSVFISKLEVLKHELRKNKSVKGVTATYDIPGKEHLSLFSNFRSVRNTNELVSLYYSRIDYDFVPLFNAKLLAGRNFDLDMTSDHEAILLNKEALQTLGFDNAESAIDKDISYGREPNLRKVKIIGVVDFRSNSFKQQNYPVVYQINWAPLRYLSIKFTRIEGVDVEANLASIEQQWENLFPEQPFDYFFLEEFFNRQYEPDKKFSTMLILFTGLGIFIACLGLYGLSMLIVLQRTKEIGIRKVLGASVKNLFFMVTRDFTVLIVIAGIISVPITYYSLSRWLTNYAYQTNMSWWIFLLPIVVMMLTVIVTVGQQALKASLRNPVESLRNE